MSRVTLIKPRRIGDDRGWFSETYKLRELAASGIADTFVQDNHSMSTKAGTLRGLHFQTPPHAQAKLVRCTRGRLLDVAVDVRRGSPAYGRHVSVELSAVNGHQLYIPVGFAHAFLTLEPDCEVIYKVSDYYAPECDGGIRFDDPAIGIAWPAIAEGYTLSDKDKRLPLLAEFDSPFAYDGEPLSPDLT